MFTGWENCCKGRRKGCHGVGIVEQKVLAAADMEGTDFKDASLVGIRLKMEDEWEDKKVIW